MPSLTRDDWDFETERLPEREVRACHAHEYGREVAKRCKRISKLLHKCWRGKKSPLKSPARYQGHLAEESLYTLGFSGTLLLRADYVALNWYSLPDDVRKGAIQQRVWSEKFDAYSKNSGALLISPMRELDFVQLTEWLNLPFAHWPARCYAASNCTAMRLFQSSHEFFEILFHRDSQQVEYGFFAIDWKCKDHVLAERFTTWLKEQRAKLKERGFVIRKMPPRGGLRDQLRCLGALRIRDHYGRSRLVDSNFKRLKVDAPYKNLPDLYEAAKAAEQIINAWIQATKETAKPR